LKHVRDSRPIFFLGGIRFIRNFEHKDTFLWIFLCRAVSNSRQLLPLFSPLWSSGQSS
jgi:hypothetical protein